MSTPSRTLSLSLTISPSRPCLGVSHLFLGSTCCPGPERQSLKIKDRLSTLAVITASKDLLERERRNKGGNIRSGASITGRQARAGQGLRQTVGLSDLLPPALPLGSSSSQPAAPLDSMETRKVMGETRASSTAPAVTITKRQPTTGTQLSHKYNGIIHSLNKFVLSANWPLCV